MKNTSRVSNDLAKTKKELRDRFYAIKVALNFETVTDLSELCGISATTIDSLSDTTTKTRPLTIAKIKAALADLERDPRLTKTDSNAIKPSTGQDFDYLLKKYPGITASECKTIIEGLGWKIEGDIRRVEIL